MVTRLDGAGLRGAPLVLPEIRAALHGDLAVGPRLLRGPLDRVVGVLLIVDERNPDALRLVASSHVLEDVHVAPLREVHRGIVGGWKPFGAVGCDRQQDRMTPVAGRPIDIGVQRDAVAHAHGNTVVDDNVVSRRHVRREAHLPRVLNRRQRRLRRDNRISAAAARATHAIRHR